MLKKFGAVAFVALMFLSVGLAEDYVAKVKKIDPDKKIITITFKDGDKEKDLSFPVDKEAKIESQTGVKKKPIEKIANGLAGIPAGTDVVIGTEKIDGKDVVVKIVKVFTPKKKK